MATSYLDERAALSAALQATFITFAEVMSLLGDIPPERMIAVPAPGSATAEDCFAAFAQRRKCELYAGVLVEKPKDPLPLPEFSLTTRPKFPPLTTFAEVMALLGDIPAERICARPAPGSATVADVIAADAQHRRLELVAGVLIEKVMGVHEGRIGALLIGYLHVYLMTHKVGATFSDNTIMQLMPDTVRIPDVSFYRWERFPNGKTPRTPVTSIAPSLAVEILSKSNHPHEMNAKLRDFFQAGVELVWYIDPAAETARLFTSPDDYVAIDRTGCLDGGAVLPGFQLSLGELFDSADR